jgi:hypothetical protein
MLITIDPIVLYEAYSGLVTKQYNTPMPFFLAQPTDIQLLWSFAAATLNNYAMLNQPLEGERDFYDKCLKPIFQVEYEAAASTPGSTVIISELWKFVCGWFSWPFEAQQPEADVAVGSKWRLKASGHEITVTAVSGTKATIKYSLTRTEAEIDIDDLKKSAEAMK